MARIKISDMPKALKLSKEELRMVTGGKADNFHYEPISYEDLTPAFGAGPIMVDTALAWKDLSDWQD